MKMKITALTLLFSFAVFFLPARPAHAQGLPFGGLATFSIPCTCSATLAVWFTPLYLGGPIVITGPIVYSPYSTIPYAYYMTGVPGVWHLGSYLPGVQACWMYAVAGCFPFPTIGLMTKVGTSRLF
ncbi:MAG: hypothetical protein UY54_C0003G0005 [Parcubacteria group bacterium GW2011_GWA2_50_10b]|nr:MAG: hypothetical protein UY54_C0003G0005 [Parcubacteria group bacterium GW2011_GWA2_50_10b]